MRSVFVGNLDHNARKSDVERLFGRYGRVARVEMIRGYAFVYLEDERDAAEAIRKLDKCPFGKEKRRLSVAWAKSEHSRPPGDGKANSNQKPSKTLYVTNFDPVTTKEHHIENHFEPYGKVISARITGNFAFVQFATQEDATKALEATRRSKILDRFIVIEYALKYGDQRTDQYAGGSPRRSLSPVYRTRPSPDYDRYKGPSAHERRKSPSAHEKRKSPAPGERRRKRRRSPTPDERRRSRAPDELRRSPAAHERRRSPAAHESRRSPARRSRRSPGDRRRSPAPCERRKSPDYGRRSSDYGRPRSSDDDRHKSRSPGARGRR